MNIFEYLNLYT